MKNTVITHGLLAESMIDAAKRFRKDGAFADIVRAYAGTKVDESVVRVLIGAYVRTVRDELSEYEIEGYLTKKLDLFAPDATDSVRWNRHLHDADPEEAFGPVWADALLTLYINHAYAPGDLGLRVKHIRMEEEA